MAVFRGREKPAPDLRFGPLRAGRHAMHAVRGDPADRARVGRRKPDAAFEAMRIVARENGDIAGVEGHRRHPVDLDDQLAGPDVVIAHQRFGDREERLEMARRELRVHTEIAGELAVDDHPAA